MACFSGRVCTNAVSIFSLPLLKFSIGSRSAFLGVELRLTHAVTHEQKRETVERRVPVGDRIARGKSAQVSSVHTGSPIAKLLEYLDFIRMIC